MKNFPKTIVVVTPDPDDFDDDEFEITDCDIYSNIETAVNNEVEGTKVAVYELKKQGEVKTTRKVVFE